MASNCTSWFAIVGPLCATEIVLVSVGGGHSTRALSPADLVYQCRSGMDGWPGLGINHAACQNYCIRAWREIFFRMALLHCHEPVDKSSGGRSIIRRRGWSSLANISGILGRFGRSPIQFQVKSLWSFLMRWNWRARLGLFCCSSWKVLRQSRRAEEADQFQFDAASAVAAATVVAVFVWVHQEFQTWLSWAGPHSWPWCPM